MARNKETFTYELKAEANTKDAENKINSMLNKLETALGGSGINVEGVDKAVKQLNNLKRKQQELIDQNARINEELNSSTFSSKLVDMANNRIDENIKKLNSLRDDIKKLKSEYSSLGVDLEKVKISDNNANKLASELKSAKDLRAEYAKLAMMLASLNGKLKSDSGNTALQNKASNLKAQMQAIKDSLKDIENTENKLNKTTKVKIEPKVSKLDIKEIENKTVDVKVNPKVDPKPVEINATPKVDSKNLDVKVIPKLDLKDLKENPIKIPVIPKLSLKELKDNPIKIPVIPRLILDSLKERPIHIPVIPKIDLKPIKDSLRDIVIPLSISDAKVDTAKRKIDELRSKLGHEHPLEVYFEAKNADFLLHRIQEYEFLRDNKMTRQPLVVNMRLSQTTEEILKRIENLSLRIKLTEFRKDLNEASKVLNDKIPQPIRRNIAVEIANESIDKLKSKIEKVTKEKKISLNLRVTERNKDEIKKEISRLFTDIEIKLSTRRAVEALGKLNTSFSDVLIANKINNIQVAFDNLRNHVANNPIKLAFDVSNWQSVKDNIINTKTKIKLGVTVTKKSINEAFKFVREEIDKKAPPKLVLDISMGKAPFKELERYIIGYINTVKSLSNYKLDVNIDLKDSLGKLKELKDTIGEVTSSKRNIKLHVDYSDVTKAIRALLKVIELINSLPSANIRITGLNGGFGGRRSSPPTPPASGNPLVSPSDNNNGGGTPPIQSFVTLRQQLEDAIRAADKAWQAGGNKTSAEFDQAKEAVDRATRALLEFNRAAGQISLSRQATELERMASAIGINPKVKQSLLNQAASLRAEQQEIRDVTKAKKWKGPEGFGRGAKLGKYSDSTAGSIKTLSGMPGFMGEEVERLAYFIRFGGRASKGAGSALEAFSQFMVDTNRVREAYKQEAESAKLRLAAAKAEIKARAKDDARRYLAENPDASMRDAVRFMRDRRSVYAKEYNLEGIRGEISKSERGLTKFDRKVGIATNIGKVLAGIGLTVTTIQSVVTGFDVLTGALSTTTNILTQFGRTIYQLLQPGIELYKEQQSALFSFTASLMSNAKVGGQAVDQGTAMGVSKGLIQRAMLDAEMSAFSLEELLRSLQGTMPLLLNLGMNAEQAYEVNKGVAGVAKMIQLTPSQILQETRDMAQGSITSRGSQVANALGITNQDLAKFGDDAEARFNFLMERFKNFTGLLNDFEDTALGRYQQFQERWQATTMKIVEGVAPLFKGLFENLIQLTGRYEDANGNYLDAITGEWHNAAGEIIASSDDIKNNGYAAYGIDANSLGFKLSEGFEAAKDVLKDILIYLAEIIDDTVAWTAEFFDIEQSGNGIKDVVQVVGKVIKFIISLSAGLYKMLIRYSDTILMIIQFLNIIVSLVMGIISGIKVLVDIVGGFVLGLHEAYMELKKILSIKWGKMDAKGNITWEEDDSAIERDRWDKINSSATKVFDRDVDALTQSLKNIFDPIGQFTSKPSGNGGFLSDSLKMYDGKVVDGSDKAKNTGLTLKDMQGTFNKATQELSKEMKAAIKKEQKLYKDMVAGIKEALQDSLADLKELQEKNELDFKQGLKPMQDYYAEKTALDKAEHEQRLQELELQKEFLLNTSFENPYDAVKEYYSLNKEIRTEQRAVQKATQGQEAVLKWTGKLVNVQSNVDTRMRDTASKIRELVIKFDTAQKNEQQLINNQVKASEIINKNLKEGANALVDAVNKLRGSSGKMDSRTQKSMGLMVTGKGLEDAAIAMDLPLDVVKDAASALAEMGELTADNLKDILAIAKIESNGRQSAVSGAGAVGVMQLMPGTFNEISGKYFKGMSLDINNQLDNLRVGAAYLIKELRGAMGFDSAKSVYAYNSGPGGIMQSAENRAYGPKFFNERLKLAKVSLDDLAVSANKAANATETAGGTLLEAVNGTKTSEYGWRTHPISGTQKFHAGVDIGSDYGTAIPATRMGKVKSAGWISGYGNTVIIDHGDFETLFGHMQKIADGIQEGVDVVAGQTLGYVGSTGNSTGPHVHFEVRNKKGGTEQPEYYWNIDKNWRPAGYAGGSGGAQPFKLGNNLESLTDTVEKVTNRFVTIQSDLKKYKTVDEFLVSQDMKKFIETPAENEVEYEFKSKFIDSLADILNKELNTTDKYSPRAYDIQSALNQLERYKGIVEAGKSAFPDQAKALTNMEARRKELNAQVAILNNNLERVIGERERDTKAQEYRIKTGKTAVDSYALRRLDAYTNLSTTNPENPAYYYGELFKLRNELESLGYKEDAIRVREILDKYWDSAFKDIENQISMANERIQEHIDFGQNDPNLTPLQKTQQESDLKAFQAQINFDFYNQLEDKLNSFIVEIEKLLAASERTIANARRELEEKSSKRSRTQEAANMSREVMNANDKDSEAYKKAAEEYANYAKELAKLDSEIAELNRKIAKESGAIFNTKQQLDYLNNQKLILEMQRKINERMIEQNETLVQFRQKAKEALEDGLVTFLTDGVNEAESLGAALRDLVVNWLKTIQKFFAEKVVTDLMTMWFGGTEAAEGGFHTSKNGVDARNMPETIGTRAILDYWENQQFGVPSTTLNRYSGVVSQPNLGIFGTDYNTYKAAQQGTLPKTQYTFNNPMEESKKNNWGFDNAIKKVNDSALGLSDTFSNTNENVGDFSDKLKDTIESNSPLSTRVPEDTTQLSSSLGVLAGQIDSLNKAQLATLNTQVFNVSTSFGNLNGVLRDAIFNFSSGISSKKFSHGGVVHAASGHIFRNLGSGLISGPGTGTSDSIPAMVSNGEAILSAKAVKQLGVNFINSVNRGDFTKIRAKLPTYSSGGIVGDASQTTARGITDFASSMGKNISVNNNMSIALVRDEQEAMRHFMKTPEFERRLVDFSRGNGRVFSRFGM